MQAPGDADGLREPPVDTGLGGRGHRFFAGIKCEPMLR